jgi:hypothetical protein
VTISFTCPYCGIKGEVADEYAGQSGPCAGCGRLVDIPLPGATELDLAARASLVTQARPRRSTRWILGTLFVLAVLLSCAGGAAVLFVPVMKQYQRDLAKASCAGNLEKILTALRSYHAEFGTFPPSCLVDRRGAPMHSWRVLILPFLGEQDLYDAYDFDEPWDSAANRRLAMRMPAVYQCPAESGPVDRETSYLMLAGPGWISDGPRASRLSEISDGASNTVIVAEVPNSAVFWTDPVDLSDLTRIDSYHGGTAHIGFADGTTMEWPVPLNADYFVRWATIAGNDNLGP